MKKFLLLLLVVLIFPNSNAQVIELMGKGIMGETTSELQLNSVETISKVDAYVVSKGLYALPPLNGVLFDNGGDVSSDWNPIIGDQYLSGSPDESVGYYYRSFDNPDQDKINVAISIPENVHSFYTYVHRNKNLTDSYKSYKNLAHVFMFHNGSEKAYTYNIPIEMDTDRRDITIKIPVSELDDGDRNMIIDITAGPISRRFVENTYNNLKNSLLIVEYSLKDVPGTVDEININIWSPFIGDPEVSSDGDSFFVGGVVADVEKVFNGCTLTQGYWKNHSDCKTNGKGPERDVTWDLIEGEDKNGNPSTGEATIFFKSAQDYCEVFETNAGKGGKYYNLAHQYMAAELNLLSDADPSSIHDAFNEATNFFKMYSPNDVNGNKELEEDCVRLGKILDDFNNGLIGTGHCDDNDEASNGFTKIQQEKKVSIYPNPASQAGKIEFNAKQGGTTTIELYNVNGQKAGLLYKGKSKKNDDVVIEFDASQFKSGLYFAIIKNGSDVYREKISITE